MRSLKTLLLLVTPILALNISSCQNPFASSNAETSTSSGTSTQYSSSVSTLPQTSTSSSSAPSSSTPEAELESIDVTPLKTIYAVGETVQDKDLVVTAKYSNGSSVVITDYTIDKTYLALTDTEYTVSYGNESATVAIEVHTPQIFEAEDALLSGGLSIRAETAAMGKYTGTGYVGGFDGKAGGSVTFAIDSDRVAQAEFYVVNDIASADSNGVAFTDHFTITVNGVPFESAAEQHVVTPGWFEFAHTDLGTVSLAEGKNTIVLTSINAMTNMDSVYFSSAAELTKHVIVENGTDYLFEGEAADSNAWDTDQFWKVSDSGGETSPSGGVYVGHINDVKGTKEDSGDYYYLEFGIYAQTESTTVISIQIGAAISISVDTDFPMYINGVKKETRTTVGPSGWTTWTKYQLGEFELQSGFNTVRFEDVNATLNFDCLIINSQVELSSTPLTD